MYKVVACPGLLDLIYTIIEICSTSVKYLLLRKALSSGLRSWILRDCWSWSDHSPLSTTPWLPLSCACWSCFRWLPDSSILHHSLQVSQGSCWPAFWCCISFYRWVNASCTRITSHTLIHKEYCSPWRQYCTQSVDYSRILLGAWSVLSTRRASSFSDA